MPTVTLLKTQRNGKRINVYVDGKFKFGTDLDTLAKLKIKVDKHFSEEELNKIIIESEFQKNYLKIINFVTLRPRSEKEVKEWCRRKKINKEQEGCLIDKIKNLDLLDDYKFTKWWVEQRISFKKISRRQLSSELIQKGIVKKIINEVLEENPLNEKDIAYELISKKIYKWEKYDEKIKKQKICEFLSRKGFSWEIIETVLNKLFK